MPSSNQPPSLTPLDLLLQGAQLHRRSNAGAPSPAVTAAAGRQDPRQAIRSAWLTPAGSVNLDVTSPALRRIVPPQATAAMGMAPPQPSASPAGAPRSSDARTAPPPEPTLGDLPEDFADGDLPYIDAAAAAKGKDPVTGIGQGSNRKSAKATAGAVAAVTATPTFGDLKLADTFLLHSKPSAQRTIFLDFDGFQSSLKSRWESYANYLAVGPYFASITDAVKAEIQTIWKTIAEDYAPFDVDVTTQDPGSDRLINSGNGDTQWGIRAVFTDNLNLATGKPILNATLNGGGNAYLYSFNDNQDEPALIFNKGAYVAAESGSHEIGHTLGLSHDGTPNAGYYPGHGSGATSWGSIMGAAYLGNYANVTTWSKGDYYNANNKEDDLYRITLYGGFGYRSDDVGNSIAAAKSLTGTSFQTFGVIEQNTDVDYYTFLTGNGHVSLSIDHAVQAWIASGVGDYGSQSFSDKLLNTARPNLDISANLYRWDGTLIATSNPIDGLTAAFDLDLQAGRYYVSIDGVGVGTPLANPPSGYTDYGSLGQYVFSGLVQDPSGVVLTSNDPAITSESGGSVTYQVTLIQAPTNTVTVNISSSNTAEGQVSVSSMTFTPQDWNVAQTLVVTGQDDAVEDGRIGYTISFDTSSSAAQDYASLPTRVVKLSNDDNDGPDLSFSGPGQILQEGVDSSAMFTLTLSRAAVVPVMVTLNSVDGSATAGSDVQAYNQTVTFSPGQTTVTVPVNLINDSIAEPDESFDLKITAVVNANLTGPSLQTAQITDTATSSTTTTLVPGLDVLRLTGTDPINGTGNSTSNLIVGNSGNNRLKGGGGLDQLQGNGGLDQFDLSGISSAADGTTILDFAPGDVILLGDSQTSRLGTSVLAINPITSLTSNKITLATGTGLTSGNKTSVGYDLFLVNTSITETGVDLSASSSGSQLFNALYSLGGSPKLSTSTTGGKAYLGAYQAGVFYLYAFNANTDKTLAAAECPLIAKVFGTSPLLPGSLTAANFAWA